MKETSTKRGYRCRECPKAVGILDQGDPFNRMAGIVRAGVFARGRSMIAVREHRDPRCLKIAMMIRRQPKSQQDSRDDLTERGHWSQRSALRIFCQSPLGRGRLPLWNRTI